MIIVSFIQSLLYTAVDPETYNNKLFAVTPDDNGTVLVPCGRIGPVTANGIDINLIGVRNTLETQKTPKGSFDVYAIANYGDLSNSEYTCKVTTNVENQGRKVYTSQISLKSKHGR